MPTWKDFTEFYNNPVIQKLANNQKWTVSTTKVVENKKNKMPIDMHAFIHDQKIYGASFSRGYNPFVTLPTLCEVLPDAINNAYYLDSQLDGYIVLDIEPGCPDSLKERFMELPYLYAEKSMSGNGIHLVFETPFEIMNKYPNSKNEQSMRDPNGYYEILLNHMITFTRNALPPAKIDADISIFENIFELLAMNVQNKKESDYNKTVTVNINIDDVPYGEEMVDYLRCYNYGKTIYDFPQKGNKQGYDNSGYEYGMCGFYYRLLNQILPNYHREYTAEEKAAILYDILSEKLEPRAKHEEYRKGMPWLMFIAASYIAKN